VLDDLKLRYKEMHLLKRLSLCAILALLPAVWLYIEDSTVVEENYVVAEQQEKAAAAKLLEADNQLKNLAKTESELAYTHEQLKKAQTRLPDNVIIDEILRSVGKAAKDASVTISLFEPQPESVRGDDFKYIEMPLKINVEAKDYSQLAIWLDSIAGSKSKMYLKSWSITRRAAGSSNEEALANLMIPLGDTVLDPSVLVEQDAKRSREGLRLALAANLSVYKLSPTSGVASAMPAVGANAPQTGSKAVSDVKPVESQNGGPE
jgi:Tfp pilus assembly protein PilO